MAELIANNGVFVAEEEKLPKPRRSLVKRGALLGATLTFIGFPLAFLIFPLLPPYGILHPRTSIAYISYWVALMAIIGASGYLKRLITNIFNIFSEEEPSPSKKISSPRGPTLQAAYGAPIADSGQQFIATTKMAHPSSITEQTTSRLNKV